MANGSLPSISGVFSGALGDFWTWGGWAPRLARVADGTRFTSAEPQVGHSSSRRFFCDANWPAEENQPSKRCPDTQSRSKTIIWTILQWGDAATGVPPRRGRRKGRLGSPDATFPRPRLSMPRLGPVRLRREPDGRAL